MGEREQKGKEGSRMQPYCVSWRDLDSEALVLRSVLRPCFRLRLQHLPPATPVPSSNTPLHTARIRTHYHVVWKCVWKGSFSSPRWLRHREKSRRYCVGKKPMTFTDGRVIFGWCNRASPLFRSHCLELGHCLHVAVLRTAHSGRQQSRFRRLFLMHYIGTCLPVKHNCLDCKNAPMCTMYCYGTYLCEQIYVLMTCIQMSASKIFIYLAETIFIAGNVDEFLVYFLTLPWCLLSPRGVSVCLSMRLLVSIFTGNHTVTLKMTIGLGNVQNYVFDIWLAFKGCSGT